MRIEETCRYLLFLFLALAAVYIVVYLKLVYLAENKNGESLHSTPTYLIREELCIKRAETENHVTVSNCPKLSVSLFNQSEHSWQAVSEKGDIFLYSAFLVTGKVRLIGIRVKGGRKLTCQTWHRNETSDKVVMETSPALIQMLPAGEKHRYRNAYVICDNTHSLSPFAVSIVDGNVACRCPNNAFHIHKHHTAKSKRYNFTICVPPVRGDYPPTHRLIEWIEMNRLLGVEFFTFYNESMNGHVVKILKQYEEQGVVEILRWNRPTIDVHYGAQIASIYDCLQRNQGRATFTSFQDLDEVIIPRHPEDLTWADMLKRLPVACSYSFKNSFFVGNYSQDTESVDRDFIERHSYVLNRLTRQIRIFGHNSRTKVIVKPDEISLIGVHDTYACKSGKNAYFVNTDIGMIHHYRNDEMHKKYLLVSDTTTLKFKHSLSKRFRQIQFHDGKTLENNHVL